PAIVAQQHARIQHWYTSLHQFYDFISSKWDVTIAQYSIFSHRQQTTDKKSKPSQGSTTINSFNSWLKNILGSWKVDPLNYLMVVAGLIFAIASVLVMLRMLMVRKKKLSTLQL